MYDVCRITSGSHGEKVEKGHALRLSLRPLLALRIAFRECDVFFLGTASKNGGNNSSSESRGDTAHLNDVHADTWGKKVAKFGRRARVESATVVAMGVSTSRDRANRCLDSRFGPFQPQHCFLRYQESKDRHC